MLKFINYLDDRFHLLSENSKPGSVLHVAQGQLEQSQTDFNQKNINNLIPFEKPGRDHETLGNRNNAAKAMKTERIKGLKLKTELQSTHNQSDPYDQKSLGNLRPFEHISPLKNEQTQQFEGMQEAINSYDQQKQLDIDFLQGLENSIKFIDQQNSLTPSQLKALALFENSSQSQVLTAPLQRRSTGQQAREQPNQSDNQSLSSVQMLLKLQQRKSKPQALQQKQDLILKTPGASSTNINLQGQSQSQCHNHRKSHLLSNQRPVIHTQNPSEMREAEERQDISPMKLMCSSQSGETFRQQDVQIQSKNLTACYREDESVDDILGADSPIRNGQMQKMNEEFLKEGMNDNSRAGRVTKNPLTPPVCEKDASFYSFL